MIARQPLGAARSAECKHPATPPFAPPAQGNFTAADFVPLPPNYKGLPTVGPVTNHSQFMSKLRAGEIYVNVHSVRLPAGEARGNFRQE